MKRRVKGVGVVALLAAFVAPDVTLADQFTPVAGSPFSTGGKQGQRNLVADFNNDGDPDVAVINQDSGNFTVLLGDGTGLGAPGPGVAAPNGGIAAGDFDEDTDVDLVVTNYFTGQVHLYENTGVASGVFAAAPGSPLTIPGVPVQSITAVDVGDLNGDDDPEIAIGDSANDRVALLTGNTSSSGFGFTSSFHSVEDQPHSVLFKDFTGEGNLDLAVGNLEGKSVSVFVGDGAGALTPATGSPFAVPGRVFPDGLAAADVNEDGDVDIAVVQPDEGQVELLAGDGTGAFTTLGSGVNVSAQVIALDDLSGDGLVDLAAVNGNATSISAMVGDGAGGFFPIDDTFPHATAPIDVSVADMTDGPLPDVLVSELGDGSPMGPGALVELYANGFAPVDVRPVVTPDPSAVEEGQIFKVSLGVQNLSANDAANAALTIPLTGGVTFLSAVSDFRCVAGIAAVTCHLGPAAGNSTVTSAQGISLQSGSPGPFNATATATTANVDSVPGNDTKNIAVTIVAASAAGAPIGQGDIVVSDLSAWGSLGGLIKVDPATGARDSLSAPGLPPAPPSLQSPYGIAFDRDGTIVVGTIDTGFAVDPAQIVRIDPATGSRTLLSADGVLGSGEAMSFPVSLAVEPDGSILVLENSSSGEILRVNAATGDRTELSGLSQGAGAPFDGPTSVAVSQAGEIFVAQWNGDPTDGVVEIDPVTGDRTPVSQNGGPGSGPAFSATAGLAVEADGSIIVIDQFNGVIRVNPATGDREVVSDAVTGSGPAFAMPFQIADAPDGTIYVTDFTVGVVGVDPDTGDREIVSSNSNPVGAPAFSQVFGVAVRDALFADLSVTVDAPAQVESGAAVDYTLVAHNAGADDASGVEVVSTLPSGFTYNDGASDPTCAPGPAAGQVTCSIGLLDAGAPNDKTLHIAGTGPAGPASLHYTAAISGDQTDSTPGNDSDSADTTVKAVPPPDPDPVPDESETLVADNVTGTVLIQLPDGTFVPLTGKIEIPFGSVIDAEEGSVEIATEGRKGRTRSAVFSGAKFQVEDAEKGRLTEIILKGGGINSCPVKPIRGGKAAKKKKPKRTLYASGGSGHRTTGAYGSATVRGTRWKTIDTCKGTRLVAIEHSITVNDFARDRELIVREGDNYFAKAR